MAPGRSTVGMPSKYGHPVAARVSHQRDSICRCGYFPNMPVQPFENTCFFEANKSWQNGYAERLLRTIKEEEVDLSEYLDYGDALQQIGRFLDDVYTHKRIHSSLGYLTPAEFEVQWLEEQQTAQIVN